MVIDFNAIMKNFNKFFKKRKWANGFVLSVFVFVSVFSSHASSVREVSQSAEQLRSIGSVFQFAILGDSQKGEKVYLRLMERILDRKPDFIIHLGDMISKSDEKEWRRFFEITKRVDVPFFPVIGNHEIAGSVKGEKIYREQFLLPEDKTYYAFRAGGALFVNLDSEKGKGRIVGEQWSWLENILSSSNETAKLVCIHRPLFLPMDSFKAGRAMDRYPLDRDNLHRLFLKTKVKAVFAGDDHRYDRREEDHIAYVITGGGGSPIYALEERGGYFHYVWISVRKGRMECEVVDLEGKIRDRFIIE